MPDGGGQIVSLHQGEGWAGDFERRVGGAGANEGAGEGGFAGAKRAVQEQDIAGTGARGETRGERLGGGFIGGEEKRLHG